MELKINASVNEIVPELKFYGDTYEDELELKKIKEVGELADQALFQLEELVRKTDGHRGNTSAEKMRKEIIKISKNLKTYFDEDESSLGEMLIEEIDWRL